EGMSQKFKVGDKVRCINSFRCINSVGDWFIYENAIYEIEAIHGDYLYFKNIPSAYLKTRFELVEESDPLQELVDKANEGLKALQEIQKQYPGEIEYKEFRSREKDRFNFILRIYENDWPVKLRIKTKKTFKPFTTSSGW